MAEELAGDWAIVVGICPYAHTDMDTLKGPTRDATEFSKWLRDEKGGNIQKPDQPTEDDPERIKFVTPEKFKPPENWFSAQPYNSDIDAYRMEIEEWLERHKKRGHRLYIYMSGHGCTTNDDLLAQSQALFMTNANSNLQIAKHIYPSTSCAKYMWRKGHFKEVILIMDCCRFKEDNTVSPISFKLMGDTTTNGQLIEAYATQWNLRALERPLPPDNVKRGVFSYALLRVLKSGKVTAAELRESVREHVRRLLKDEDEFKDERQIPEPDIRGEPEDDWEKIMFSENARPSRTLITFKRQSGMPPPQVMCFDNQTYEKVPVKKEPGDPDDPWQWFLPPGEYGLQVGDKKAKPFKVWAALPEEKKVILL